jgi:hypothetical protein
MRTTAVLVLAAALFVNDAPDTAKEKKDLNGTVAVHCSDYIGTVSGFSGGQVKVKTQFFWQLTQPSEQLDTVLISVSQTQPLSRTTSCNISVVEIEGFLAALDLVEELMNRNYDDKFGTMGVQYTAKQGLSLGVNTTPPEVMRVVGEKRFATVSYAGASLSLRVDAIKTLRSLVIKARESIKNHQPEIERMRIE